MCPFLTECDVGGRSISDELFSAQIKNQFTSDVAVVYAFLLSIQSFVTSIKFIIHVGCRRVFLNGSEKNIEVKLKRYS